MEMMDSRPSKIKSREDSFYSLLDTSPWLYIGEDVVNWPAMFFTYVIEYTPLGELQCTTPLEFVSEKPTSH